MQQLIQEQTAELLQQQPLDAFCHSYCSQHAGSSVRHAAAAAEALCSLDNANAAEAGQLIASFRSGKGGHS